MLKNNKIRLNWQREIIQYHRKIVINMLSSPQWPWHMKLSVRTFVHSHWGFQHLFPHAKKLHLLADVVPSSLHLVNVVAIILVQDALKLPHHLWHIQFTKQQNVSVRQLKLEYKILFCLVLIFGLCLVNTTYMSNVLKTRICLQNLLSSVLLTKSIRINGCSSGWKFQVQELRNRFMVRRFFLIQSL